ncbi:MAG TPA: AAA family ATPase [Kribbella sp.]
MRIREVLVRWYKSFNYDYELKFAPTSKKKDWQVTADGWLPHVRVNLERDITAVVGANESGKSHLLDAIHIVLSGEDHSRRDFCRYSTLFSVERDKRLYPEVGAVFTLSNDEQTQLTALQIPLQNNGDLLMLRPSEGVVQVLNANDERVQLNPTQAAKLQALLPKAYKLQTQVDLPDSVPLAALAGSTPVPYERNKRFELLKFLSGVKGLENLQERVAGLFSLLEVSRRSSQDESGRELAARQRQLGQDLLTKLARIDQSSFEDLMDAIAKEREGLVNALIQEMNQSIARHLNISRWWSQDEDFALRVSPREHELVFTIRDRTGTDYSFSERSRGLTYFLSYFVQLWSHDRPAVPEVLLMDEPDAYLSAVGQQDLLRILEHYAHPDNSEREDQVVYVTHSPFLINRNAGHRVRVVDKGSGDEGTRLVSDATRNHYEPLRTSLGAFVAETAFIGGDNLFVEGISDQVLISGMNARLRLAGTPPSRTLDLNEVTLVPGGSNMPYMLYLARGRDQFKPACAVLLDSDGAGQEARRQIKKGGAKGRPTVPDDLILMLADAVPGAVAEPGVVIEEPEDLVPLVLAGMAARRYAKNLLGLSEQEADILTNEAILAGVTSDKPSLWDAIESAFQAAFDTGIGKAGFAKELIAYLSEHANDEVAPEGVDVLDTNFAALIATLSETLVRARETEIARRRDRRVEQLIVEFVDAYPDGCIRDRALVALRRIEAAADDTEVGDVIRAGLATIRRDHELTAEPLKRITDYPLFRTELEALPLLPRLRNQGRMEIGDLADTDGRADALTPSGVPAAVTKIEPADVTDGSESGEPLVSEVPARDDELENGGSAEEDEANPLATEPAE